MTGSSGHSGRGFAPAVLSLVTDVLEAVDSTTGARICFCRTTADLFSSATCCHAWYDAGCQSWSACLWRLAPAGMQTITLTKTESAVEPLGDWWSWTSCRATVHEWMAAPFLAEVPLRIGATTRGLVVLGRDHAFGNEDARRISVARRHLVAVERIVMRLEAPVLAGGTPGALTTRESQVLELLSRGLLARSIAQRLQVSERTVHKHLGSLYRKLDAHDRLMAVRRAESMGLISAPAGAASLSSA